MSFAKAIETAAKQPHGNYRADLCRCGKCSKACRNRYKWRQYSTRFRASKRIEAGAQAFSTKTDEEMDAQAQAWLETEVYYETPTAWALEMAAQQKVSLYNREDRRSRGHLQPGGGVGGGGNFSPHWHTRHVLNVWGKNL